MAKFTAGDLRLKDNQKVTFGADLDSNLWWDGTANELRLDTVISGADPTQDYHLTTRQYVATTSGLIDHANLLNIGSNTHVEIDSHISNMSNPHNVTIDQITPTSAAGDLLVENGSNVVSLSVGNEGDILVVASGSAEGIQWSSVSGAIDHGDLGGLGDDDHPQYILVDGTRGFTGTVSGVTPTDPAHLTTKQYVDDAVYGLDWKDSVLDVVPVASGVQVTGNRYIASATGGGWTINQIYEWDGTQWVNDPVDEGAAAWLEDEDGVYTFNGTSWVKFGSTVTHNNLSGLQGGTSNEYYHLTSTMYTDLTNAGGVTDASSQHTHDNRYYTETEVDTISGTLQTQIDGKDNYASWSFAVNGVTKDAITSGDIFNIVGGDNITVTRSAEDEVTISGASGGGSNIVTVGSSGADYNNFDDAIDFLRTLNGGKIIVTSDMTITSTAIKDISHIEIEGDLTYAGVRKINKTVNGGYWYGRDVLFKDLSFYRLSDTGSNEIFRYTEDYQDVTLEGVTCMGLYMGPGFESAKVFNCNGKEAHLITRGECLLGAQAAGWTAYSNPATLVLHLYDRSGIYLASDTLDACFLTSSCVIEGTPTFSTPGHPVLIEKASGTENDSSVTGDTVKDALEALDNYQGWSFAIDGVTKDTVTSGAVLNFVGGDNIFITRTAEDEITISGAAGGGSSDHGSLTGLNDDDHPQYVLVDGSRGFTNTVSGVDPVQPYDLATKYYVDQGGIDRHGRQAVANTASTVTVSFSDLGHTNYTINTTLENTTDSPPSIYAFIISARTSSSFTVTFMGDMDSANYVLNWSVIED